MTMIEKHKHSSKTQNFKKNKHNRKNKISGKNINSEWIYGIHPVLAVLANPKRICIRIIISQKTSAKFKEKIELACKNRVKKPRLEKLDKEQINSILPTGAVHQGLAILAEPLKENSINTIIQKSNKKEDFTIIILDQATDPRNIGAVLRSAAALGAYAVIMQDRKAPHLSGSLYKAASGAVEWVKLIRVVNLARTINSLKKAGFLAVGLDSKAKLTIAQANLSGRILLILGAEGSGLRRLTRESCDELVKISVNTESSSLNLSNAAAVALYELSRKNS